MVFLISLFVFNPSATELPRELPWFELQAPGKSKFTKNQLEGHWTLAYFGYTHCPDLCPASMQLAAAAAKILDSKGPNIPGLQILFVSIDPDRDTPERSQEYASFFSPAFLGATASHHEATQLLSSLDAVMGNNKDTKPEGYLVFHPTAFYLFDIIFRSNVSVWIHRIHD